MKNNEMQSRAMGLPKLSGKFENDHPVVATIIYLSPVIIPLAKEAFPVVCKGAKYLVDTVADCYRFKVMAENGVIVANPTDNFETIPDDSAVA